MKIRRGAVPALLAVLAALMLLPGCFIWTDHGDHHDRDRHDEHHEGER